MYCWCTHLTYQMSNCKMFFVRQSQGDMLKKWKWKSTITAQRSYVKWILQLLRKDSMVQEDPIQLPVGMTAKMTLTTYDMYKEIAIVLIWIQSTYSIAHTCFTRFAYNYLWQKWIVLFMLKLCIIRKHNISENINFYESQIM